LVGVQVWLFRDVAPRWGPEHGVNLNPGTARNFDCIYCPVDRTVEPRVRRGGTGGGSSIR